MERQLVLIGKVAGLLGLLLCLTGGLARLGGLHWIGGFESLTLLQGGMAGMLLGCFCLLVFLANDAGNRRS